VQAWASAACAGVAAEFGARIAAARKLPRDQVAGAIDAIKQMKRAALKAIRETAKMETRGRQEMARVLWRRRQIRSIKGGRKPWDGPQNDRC